MTGFAHIAAAGPLLLALAVSVLAGLVSFASPCVVPLVPGYLSYLAAVVGVSEQPAPGAAKAPTAARWRVAVRPRCSSPGSPRCSCSAPSRCWA
ncbi:cytochrome C biogenesis transmembrane region family protein [Mycobacterium xenopi 4042]|uniref:Cytochrome C biogenesis transmembrane region family protein n=1 Tax=Mycobacterium xenopi 4042 TaxID=1299334 RepID=X8C8M3_MYCXE|nr:cytochrome C biogenesis transmembrane region family protein [Mycobacterium xenopi 4042]